MAQSTVSVSSFDYLLLAIAGACAAPDPALSTASLEALGARVGEKLVERVAHAQRHALFASPDDALRFVCRDLWMLATRKPADRLRVTKRGAWEVQDLAFSWIAHVSAPHPGTGLVDIPVRGKQPSPTPAPAPAPADAAAAAAAAAGVSSAAVATATLAGVIASPEALATAAAAAAGSSSGGADAPRPQVGQDANAPFAPYLALFTGLLRGALAGLGLPTTVTVGTVVHPSVTFVITSPVFAAPAAAGPAASSALLRP